MKVERMGLIGGRANLCLPVKDANTETTIGELAVVNDKLAHGATVGWEQLLTIVRFTSSTIFPIPEGVDRILVVCGAGGGKGVNRNFSNDSANWVAGAGGGLSAAEIAVTPGTSLDVRVGAGGKRYLNDIYFGYPGDDSFVLYDGEYARAEGGRNGSNSTARARGGYGNVATGGEPPSRYVGGKGGEAFFPGIGTVKAGDGGDHRTDGQNGIVVVAY